MLELSIIMIVVITVLSAMFGTYGYFIDKAHSKNWVAEVKVMVRNLRKYYRSSPEDLYPLTGVTGTYDPTAPPPPAAHRIGDAVVAQSMTVGGWLANGAGTGVIVPHHGEMIIRFSCDTTFHSGCGSVEPMYNRVDVDMRFLNAKRSACYNTILPLVRVFDELVYSGLLMKPYGSPDVDSALLEDYCRTVYATNTPLTGILQLGTMDI